MGELILWLQKFDKVARQRKTNNDNNNIIIVFFLLFKLRLKSFLIDRQLKKRLIQKGACQAVWHGAVRNPKTRPKTGFRGEGKNENPKIFDLNKVKNKVKNKKGTLLKEKSNWDFWSCSGCIEVS